MKIAAAINGLPAKRRYRWCGIIWQHINSLTE
jgi:hypothetical protein